MKTAMLPLMTSISAVAAGLAAVLMMSPHVVASDSYDVLLGSFRTPDARYAGAPFFSWNDDLDEAEVRRQLNEMQNAGLGGAFLHPRHGMITPYLSDEYFDMYGASIEEGKRRGFDIWLYDEDGWPSGSAGGRVQKMNREYTIKTLMCSAVEAFAADSLALDTNTLGMFAARIEKDTIVTLRNLAGPPYDMRAGENTLLRVWVYYGRYGTLPGWFSDLLEPAAVDAFMNLTHERFRERFSGDFGRTVPGLFTDEPNWSFLPWTNGFPAFFLESRGYDIVPRLPFLFFRGDGFEKTRYDFYAAMTERFVATYTERIGRWCDENGLIFTGHMLHEDNLFVQTAHVGAVMPHYEYMSMPGIDHLTRDIADPLLVKQAASVAHQMGDRRVLSETYGGAGWNVTFDDLKRLADWQFVLGVNFTCHHLAHYSLRGVRKTDFPPSLHYHQPWWSIYGHYNRYVARILTVLSAGSHEAGILLLHPIESAWLITDPKDHTQYRWNAFRRLYQGTEVAALNDDFVALSSQLLDLHRDYDYGDETIMSRHAAVEDGRFRVGSKTYDAVVVPRSLTIRRSTFSLLDEYRRAGGTIILAGDPPTMIEGETARELDPFWNTCMRTDGTKSSLKAALGRLPEPSVTVTGPDAADLDSLYCHERAVDSMKALFMVNIRKSDTVEADVSVMHGGQVEEWRADDGTVVPLDGVFSDGRTRFRLTFAPGQSRLIVLRDGAAITERKHREKTVRTVPLDDVWSFARNHPNALTLDICRISGDDGLTWSAPAPVVMLADSLSRARANATIVLRFEFDAAVRPPDDTCLVLETPDMFEIAVNGSPVEFRDAGYYWDMSFRKTPVGRYLRNGRNTIDLSCLYVGDTGQYVAALPSSMRDSERRRLTFGAELANVHIIGDFTVSRSEDTVFTLEKETAREPSARGDLTTAGYPFYAGSVTYTRAIKLPPRREGERVALETVGFEGIAAVVRMDGREAGILAWQPYEVDLTQFAGSQETEHELSIELFGSLRNLLGPHHHEEADPHFNGPWHFTDIPRDPGVYHLVPYGLANELRITVTGEK